MSMTMSASQVERPSLKMTRYAATNIKYTPESRKSMRTRKLFKLTPTQEDIYHLINTTEERPMSSTLSPYTPLPAIGGSFQESRGRSPQPRAPDRKHQVLMETVDLRRTRTSTRGHSTTSYGSEEFIQNCIKDVERRQTIVKTPTPSKASKKEKPFTLVRERTYDLLEPKFLKAKRGDTDVLGQHSEPVAGEQFGEVSLERSTSGQLSPGEGDGGDLRDSALAQGLADLDMNDTTGDTLNNQLWQLRNASESNETPQQVGTIPRVLELRRANEGLPSASRFSRDDEGDPVLWEMRTRRMNRLNSALRVKSGRDVSISAVTPLKLDNSGVSADSHRQQIKTHRIEDIHLAGGKVNYTGSDNIDTVTRTARLRDIKTPYIEEISKANIDTNANRLVGEVRNENWDIIDKDMVEIGLTKQDLTKSVNHLKDITINLPRTEKTDSSYNKEIVEKENDTVDKDNVSERSFRVWNLKTPSIEELPTVEVQPSAVCKNSISTEELNKG